LLTDKRDKRSQPTLFGYGRTAGQDRRDQKAIAEQNLDTLSRDTHQFKGSASGYGSHSLVVHEKA